MHTYTHVPIVFEIEVGDILFNYCFHLPVQVSFSVGMMDVYDFLWLHRIPLYGSTIITVTRPLWMDI